MNDDPYRRLAQRLNELPNGFPPDPHGAELRLLAKLFTPEEADLAAHLRLTLEDTAAVAQRIGGDAGDLRKRLGSMARRGLIKAARIPGGVGFGLLPFVVGIYEMQVDTMDAELAQLFEDYYPEAAPGLLAGGPPVHRVIPVNQTVAPGIEVHPYESAAEIVQAAKAWGVLDCICRKQQALVGESCGHPVDVCMAMSPVAGAFDNAPAMRALTEEQALATLQRAAEAGLVHSVSNSQEGVWYICNCCTCSCAVLRAMVELGMANVVARSAFVNRVDDTLCRACGTCVDVCQFGALTLGDTAVVDSVRCAGCGVCVPACPEAALSLIRRPEHEVLPPPLTEDDWRAERAAARGLDLDRVR